MRRKEVERKRLIKKKKKSEVRFLCSNFLPNLYRFHSWIAPPVLSGRSEITGVIFCSGLFCLCLNSIFQLHPAQCTWENEHRRLPLFQAGYLFIHSSHMFTCSSPTCWCTDALLHLSHIYALNTSLELSRTRSSQNSNSEGTLHELAKGIMHLLPITCICSVSFSLLICCSHILVLLLVSVSICDQRFLPDNGWVACERSHPVEVSRRSFSLIIPSH